MCHLEYFHCNPILFNSGVVQGQDIVLCVIMDIVVRRCVTGCGCGDVSIAVGRPVAGGRYLHTTYIKHLSDRRSRQRRGGQQPQAEGQDAEQAQNSFFILFPPCLRLCSFALPKHSAYFIVADTQNGFGWLPEVDAGTAVNTCGIIIYHDGLRAGVLNSQKNRTSLRGVDRGLFYKQTVILDFFLECSSHRKGISITFPSYS